MKLALVTHNVIVGDGQGRVNYELARRLLQRGAEVTLVAHRVEAALLEAGAHWIPVETGAMGEAVDLVKVWRFRAEADRVLARLGSGFDVVMGCGVTLRGPHHVNAVHFAHGGWLRSPLHASRSGRDVGERSYQWLFSKLNARWERQTLKAARRVVAVSDMVRRELMDSGVAPEKLQVIFNGVDLDEFVPGPADRASLGLPEDVPVALFVGDLRSPIKNLDTLLRALVLVPAVHLVVVGRLEGSPFPALARRLGVADRVHFLGFRRDVARLMRAADLFVLPSRRDSCPLVLLEAMASGLPIITTRTVGTAALVEGSCGIVFKNPDDRHALADTLRALAYRPDRRQRLGVAARAVAAQHSWDAMTEQYVSVFEEVARQPLACPSPASAPSLSV